jgi:ABC-type branched-subunit amino acid transport system ATPase component
MLTLTSVVAGYGGGSVLQGVDLHCAEGTITCVVGPNGAGKSTVLRVISGLLRCTEGEITMAGEPIGGRPPDEILRRGIAQVPQSQALFPQMSVHENVLMGGYLIRRNKALLRERLEMVRERVPIVAERARDHAGNLSGGQRRMVEIARCLMLDPKIILLDEPSLGLDPRSLSGVAGLIGDLHSSGTTVLLVEQNVRLGLGLATQGVVMEGGKVRRAGPAAQIRDDPEIAALYLGGTPGTTPPPIAETQVTKEGGEAWTIGSGPPSRTGDRASPPTA